MCCITQKRRRFPKWFVLVHSRFEREFLQPMKELKGKAIPLNQIVEGNALEILRGFPDECIDTVITSPPYWGLRTYGTTPQIWGGLPHCPHEWHSDLNFWHSDNRDAAQT